ncbi:MAG: hypothetical protein JJU02_02405, partial [Cryomorphaceae bacterium]|nr:hypothetical protein [Cryomorphaceae bacterium]
SKTLSLLSEKLKVKNMSVKEQEAYKKHLKSYMVSEASLKDTYKLGYFEGEEKGKEKGMEKGMEKNKIETVINAFKKGYELSIIADFVSSTEEEIIEILKENKLW